MVGEVERSVPSVLSGRPVRILLLPSRCHNLSSTASSSSLRFNIRWPSLLLHYCHLLELNHRVNSYNVQFVRYIPSIKFSADQTPSASSTSFILLLLGRGFAFLHHVLSLSLSLYYIATNGTCSTVSGRLMIMLITLSQNVGNFIHEQKVSDWHRCLQQGCCCLLLLC